MKTFSEKQKLKIFVEPVDLPHKKCSKVFREKESNTSQKFGHTYRKEQHWIINSKGKKPKLLFFLFFIDLMNPND